MANLSKVIYINEEDYSTLINGGTITKSGQTYSYDESALYVIKDVSAPEYAETAGYATTAGTANVAIHDGSGNSIAATYEKKPLIIEVNESDNDTDLEQGTYDSITQAISQNRQVILKVIKDNNDNEIIYLPLVGDYSSLSFDYKFGASYSPNFYYALIDDTNYFEFYNYYLNSNDIVHKSGAETITGNKTFSGTVALGSNATATTLVTTDNDTSVATTAFVHNVVNSISVDSITNPEIDVIWNEAFGNLITFTINNTSYQTVEGMTWEQWVDSSYNTEGWNIDTNSQVSNSTHTGFINNVNSQDVIIANNNYSFYVGGGSNY